MPYLAREDGNASQNPTPFISLVFSPLSELPVQNGNASGAELPEPTPLAVPALSPFPNMAKPANVSPVHVLPGPNVSESAPPDPNVLELQETHSPAVPPESELVVALALHAPPDPNVPELQETHGPAVPRSPPRITSQLV